jgi:hypothetical protein
MSKWTNELVWIPLGFTIAWVGWQTTIFGLLLRSGAGPMVALARAQAETCKIIHRHWFFFPYAAFLVIWGWQLLHPSKYRERPAKTWEVAVLFVTIIAVLFNTIRCW